MTLLDKEPVKRVERLLKEFDPGQKVIILNTSARTALEASSSLGCEVGAIVKSLLFKTEKTFTLCLVAGDKKTSLNKIKKILNVKDVAMATADDVKNVTAVVAKNETNNFLNYLKEISSEIEKYKNPEMNYKYPNKINQEGILNDISVN